jgi:S1-C subfamily serine protease
VARRYHCVISGFVIHPDGYVVTTNDTFPKEYSRVIVSIGSEKRKNYASSSMILTDEDYEAVVVKRIPELNIVILKISRNSPFKYLNLENPSQTKSQPQRMFVAVGKALGERFIAYRRNFNSKNSFRPCISLIEESCTDGSFVILKNKVIESCVFPENAGGVLLNRKGQAVGVLDYKGSAKELFCKNIAIPASVVRKAFSLVNRPAKGSFGCAFIEVSKAKNLSKEVHKFFSKRKDKAHGAYIRSVRMDSIADQCGIMPGDIVLKVNGRLVVDVSVMKDLLKESIGDGSVVLTVVRGKNIIEVECFL